MSINAQFLMRADSPAMRFKIKDGECGFVGWM